LNTLILFDTCQGWMGVIGSEGGLNAVILPKTSPKLVIDLLKIDFVFSCDISSTCLGDLPQRLGMYMEGKYVEFPDKLDLGEATDFQQKVWQVTKTIPYGQVRSYSWVAHEIDSKNSARAVGQALARNPIPIVIPCHRVLTRNGKLGGFSAGIETKKLLLNLESEGNLIKKIPIMYK
jgi:methylated-DNA-[protein]-cysteine S-methyltransferase